MSYTVLRQLLLRDGFAQLDELYRSSGQALAVYWENAPSRTELLSAALRGKQLALLAEEIRLALNRLLVGMEP